MGNDNSAVPADPRIEKCMKVFKIPPSKIKALWDIYIRYDSTGRGYLIIQDFFTQLLEYPRNPLTDAIPGFIESRSEAYFTFAEFVEVVCTFACFEQIDLIKFIWYILDPRKIGTVDIHEIRVFFTRIWRNKPYNNLHEALEYLITMDEDNVFVFQELERLRTRYPNIFYPIYQLQQHIINYTLGDKWWTNHKAFLYEEKMKRVNKERKLTEKLEREKNAAFDVVGDDMLRRKMGMKFYLMPWTIPFERQRLAKIAAIESELESQFAALQQEKLIAA